VHVAEHPVSIDSSDRPTEERCYPVLNVADYTSMPVIHRLPCVISRAIFYKGYVKTGSGLLNVWMVMNNIDVTLKGVL